MSSVILQTAAEWGRLLAVRAETVLAAAAERVHGPVHGHHHHHHGGDEIVSWAVVLILGAAVAAVVLLIAAAVGARARARRTQRPCPHCMQFISKKAEVCPKCGGSLRDAVAADPDLPPAAAS